MDSLQQFKKRKKRLGKSKSKIRNGVLLDPFLTIGNQQNFTKKFIVALPNNEIIFQSGKHLVIYSIKTCVQQFIFKKKKEKKVLCMNYSNENSYCKLAVSIQEEICTLPLVRIYHYRMKSVDNFKHTHLSSGFKIYHVAFSHNEEFLFTFGFNKEINEGIFSLWSLKSQKLKETYKINQDIEFMDTYQVSKKGVYYLSQGQLKILKYKQKKQELIITEFQYEQNEKKINQNRLNVKGFCYNQKQDFQFIYYNNYIEFYKNEKLEQLIEPQIPDELDEDINQELKISKVCTFNNILLIGFYDFPYLLIYQINQQQCFKYQNYIKIDLKFQFKSIIEFSVSMDHSLIGIAIERSLMSFQDSENNIENNSSIELAYIDVPVLEAVNYCPEESFSFLNVMGTPGKEIIDIATCQNKSIVGLISSDRLVKIYDYSIDEKEMNYTILMRNGLAIDFHPLGIQCAIGFKEGFKLFFISEGDFKEAYESFNKEVRCVSYSQRGDMLATSSANHIMIYDPYTLDRLYSLQAHASSVKFLLWRGLDQNLISSCQNGSIYCWNTRNFQRDFEHFISNKNSQMTALEYDSQLDLLIYATDDKKMTMVYDKGNIEIFTYDISPEYITSIQIDKAYKVMFAGTQSGCILMFLWPLQIFKNQLEYFSTHLHTQGINKIIVSHDSQNLITISKDGSAYFSQLKFYDENLNKKDNENLEEESGSEQESEEESDQDFPDILKEYDPYYLNDFSEQVLKVPNFTLVTLEQITKIKGEIKDLDFHIQNIKNEIEDQNEKLLHEHQKFKQKVQYDKKQILQNQKNKLSKLMKDEQNKYDTSLTQEQSKNQQFNQQLNILEEYHEKSLMELYTENDQIKDMFVKQTSQLEQKILQIHQDYTKQLKQIENKYIVKINKIKNDYGNTLQKMKMEKLKFNEMIEQIEKEYSKQLQLKKDDLEDELLQKKKKAEEYKSLNLKLSKEAQQNKEKVFYFENLIEEATNQNNILKREIGNFEDKSKQMQGQLLVQEKNINKKEVELKNFRLQNNFLQNNKKVYDYLVKSLETEHNKLLNHFMNISSNLKIVHNKLLEEAESNKNLTVTKQNLTDQIKDMKVLLVQRENSGQNQYKIIVNLINELIVFVSDFQNDRRFLQDKIFQKIQSKNLPKNVLNIVVQIKNQINLSNKKFSYQEDQNENQNQSNKIQQVDQKVFFQEELQRLKEIYQNKLDKTRAEYSKAKYQRKQLFEENQDRGKDLINKCTDLKNKRVQLYQKLYEAKNCADNIVKEHNLKKLIKIRNKKKSYQQQFVNSKYTKNLTLQDYMNNQHIYKRKKWQSLKLPPTANDILLKAKKKLNKEKQVQLKLKLISIKKQT